MVMWDGPFGIADRFLLHFFPAYGIISAITVRRTAAERLAEGTCVPRPMKEALLWNIIARS